MNLILHQIKSLKLNFLESSAPSPQIVLLPKNSIVGRGDSTFNYNTQETYLPEDVSVADIIDDIKLKDIYDSFADVETSSKTIRLLQAQIKHLTNTINNNLAEVLKEITNTVLNYIKKKWQD